MNDIHAALEIGTTTTLLAIGETQKSGRLKVTCTEIPSSGVRKSQILNIQDATQSIRTVLRDIEKRLDTTGSSITIGNALLVASGQHIEFFPADGMVQISGSKVSDDDIVQAVQRAHDTPLPKGRELLDIVDQDFEVDSLGAISSPKGMSGKMLKLNTLHIHADANRINDARTAASEAHLEIKEPVFATSCAAEAVLDEHEKANGVMVLDLGGGSSGMAVYTDGHLVFGKVFGIGGDHVTNDIACAFQTTTAQAESLKTTESSAVLREYTTDNARVRLLGTSTLMENRTISRRALDTVVNARMRELFTIIRETLEDAGLLHRLHSGIVLTGGGANLSGIDVLAEQTFGVTVRNGRPNTVDGFDDCKDPWRYAAITGALLYSQRTYEEKSMLDGLLGRFFK